MFCESKIRVVLTKSKFLCSKHSREANTLHLTFTLILLFLTVIRHMGEDSSVYYVREQEMD